MALHPRQNAQHGFTLIELIIFIVVVSIGLAGVLLAFNTAIRGSADPMVAKQMLLIADATLQEVLQKSYQNDASDASNSSATLGCTALTTPACHTNTPTERINYNDVDDYNGFAQTGIRQLDGVSTVAGLEAYSLAIAVDKTSATLGSLAAPNVKQITVTVSNAGKSVALTGYRTRYGY